MLHVLCIHCVIWGGNIMFRRLSVSNIKCSKIKREKIWRARIGRWALRECLAAHDVLTRAPVMQPGLYSWSPTTFWRTHSVCERQNAELMWGKGLLPAYLGFLCYCCLDTLSAWGRMLWEEKGCVSWEGSSQKPCEIVFFPPFHHQVFRWCWRKSLGSVLSEVANNCTFLYLKMLNLD